MEDGDLAATAIAVPRTPGPGAGVVASRSAAPDARSAASNASERRAAVVELMRAHGSALLGFCIRILGDRGVAEEVRQQTFLEAFRDFDAFQHRASRRAWLFGIASHRCLDALRDQRRTKWTEIDDNAVLHTHDPRTGPEGQLEHAQLSAALEECMQSLSPEVRMTVLLRFQTELTYEELAPQLAARADALQMRVTRALSALRRCMASKGIYHG
jgi:RNA polymerase sigma-70 factor (ECF subfamily)